MYGITIFGNVYRVNRHPDEQYIDLTEFGIPKFFEDGFDAHYVRDMIEEEIQPNFRTRGWRPELLKEKQVQFLKNLL